MNNVFKDKNQSELASFLHATCSRPVKSTFINAANNGNLAIWPGLTAKLIAVHIPKLEATIFGNLYQTRKNTRSTKSDQLALETETSFPPKERETTILYLTL